MTAATVGATAIGVAAGDVVAETVGASQWASILQLGVGLLVVAAAIGCQAFLGSGSGRLGERAALENSEASLAALLQRDQGQRFYVPPRFARFLDQNHTSGDAAAAASGFKESGTEAPQLSVVIPAFNELERLPIMLDETLAFLKDRRQKDGDFSYEVILVDDSSRDGMSEMVS